MLVILLILFTNVLADSTEDKYVDLLPDAEKREFIERVARRILKDVQSQEDKQNAKSGELSDDDLKKHNDYVKSILKQEAENIRRSKGENSKDKSDEKGGLGVQPLSTKKMAALEEPDTEPVDLTLRSDRREIGLADDPIIHVEVVTDEVPKIKRSVQVDSSKKSDENTVETLERVQPGNNVSSLEARRSGFGEFDADAISVKGLDDPYRRSNDETKPPETTTAIVETTSVLENTGVESNGNESETYNNITSNNEEIKAVNSDVAENDTTQNTTTQSTTTITTSTSTVILTTEPSQTTTEASTTTTEVPTTTTVVPTTTTELPTTSAEIQTTENEIVTTENEIQTTENEIATTQNEIATTENEIETTQSEIETTENELETTTDFSAESTLTTTLTDEETTEAEASTTAKPKKTTETTPVTDSSETSTHGVFIPVTKGIIVEEFKSSPKKKPTIVKNSYKKQKIYIKHRALDIKVAKPTINKNNEVKTARPVIYHKLDKYIVGPKGQKIIDLQRETTTNKNFIELQKVYYDNNYKVKKGKEYQVYEIPADKSPFILDEDAAAEQPYYVPVYTYSASNAYFNPQNRRGPNIDDASPENGSPFSVSDRDKPGLNIAETPVDMEYSESAFDNLRKKFGGHQQTHYIHKQPQLYNVQQIKKHSKPNQDDYLDSDYYYGRVNERRANEKESSKFPNSNENDHPAHSMLEGNLKDHVRAVRNILFHQQSFGLLDKDKYGEDKQDKKGSETKHEKPHILRYSEKEDKYSKKEQKTKDKIKDPDNNIAIDYYFGRENKKEHLKKVGYLKDKNTTQELFTMDDDFKADVLKYIDDKKREDTGLHPATPLPQVQKAIQITKSRIGEMFNSKLQERIRNANLLLHSGTNIDNQDFKVDVENDDVKHEDVNIKLKNRRNDDVNVSVYMKVLKDMMSSPDNNALKQYDWLGTTVDVQSGLQKMFELTTLVTNNEILHPADMEILKYVLFLHKLSSEVLEVNDFGAQLRKKLLPKNKNKRKKKSKLLKEKGLLNQVLLYLRREVPEVNDDGALKNFNEFLMNIEDGLFDLHDAIRNIAKITKYRNQHWYKNLKDLYLNTDEKHLLEVLLHMSVLRFFTLIEESTKKGLEHDYIEYMKVNKADSKKTLEEMMFIMQILADYNKFV